MAWIHELFMKSNLFIMNLTKEFFETTLFEIDIKFIKRAAKPHYMFQHQQKYIFSLDLCVSAL